MKFYTHIAGGILFFLIISFPLNITSPMPGLFFAAWISVLPNLLDKIIGKDRKWGHSLIWVIPLSLVAIYSIEISLALLIGFISHLLLDSFTVYGFPAFYPFKKSGFVCLNKKRRLKTGNKTEKALFVFIIFMIVPIIFFSSGICGVLTNNALQTASAAEGGNSTPLPDNNIYLSFKLDENCDKNITVERINENKTHIIVKDI